MASAVPTNTGTLSSPDKKTDIDKLLLAYVGLAIAKLRKHVHSITNHPKSKPEMALLYELFHNTHRLQNYILNKNDRFLVDLSLSLLQENIDKWLKLESPVLAKEKISHGNTHHEEIDTLQKLAWELLDINDAADIYVDTFPKVEQITLSCLDFATGNCSGQSQFLLMLMSELQNNKLNGIQLTTMSLGKKVDHMVLAIHCGSKIVIADPWLNEVVNITGNYTDLTIQEALQKFNSNDAKYDFQAETYECEQKGKLIPLDPKKAYNKASINTSKSNCLKLLLHKSVEFEACEKSTIGAEHSREWQKRFGKAANLWEGSSFKGKACAITLGKHLKPDARGLEFKDLLDAVCDST